VSGFASLSAVDCAPPIEGGRTRDAVLVGVFAFAVSVIGAGRPSLWYDEAATLSAATRSPGELWALLGNEDAVHGLYYWLLRGWFTVFPATEFWARVPSALAVGVAAAGVVVLGRQLSVRSVGVAAGVVFAVLPRTTWAGVDARPYALTIAGAVWVTVLFVVAVERRRSGLWVAYAAALASATLANVIVLLVVVAHAVMSAEMATSRRTKAAWVAATAAAITSIVPFVVTIAQQQGQIDWIWPVSVVTLGQVAGEQYFPSVYSTGLRVVGPDQQQFTSEQLSLAVHAWARVAPFIVVVVAVAVTAALMRGRATGVVGDRPRLLMRAAAAWIVVPTAVLIAYSLVGRPVYQPHYLSFTTPALAMLIGLCVVIVGRDARRIGVILAVLGVAAVPNYVAQRGPYAKFGSDYSAVADLVSTRAARGDCLLVEDAGSPTMVAAVTGALAGADGLRDVGRGRSAVELQSLFGSRVPVTASADELRTCSVVWAVIDRHRGLPGDAPVYRIPAELGSGLLT